MVGGCRMSTGSLGFISILGRHEADDSATCERSVRGNLVSWVVLEAVSSYSW